MPAGYSPPPSFHALQRSASPLGPTRSCGVGNQTDFCELSSACDCQRLGAVGSLVVRASESISEGLGSMPDATKYHPSTHGVRAR
ncbi:hypothetical protein TNCV_3446101 [Trichonephila clavipes]|nr:hypothetical protein TNCV_3446101 [Trichonephila clavipes]